MTPSEADALHLVDGHDDCDLLACDVKRELTGLAHGVGTLKGENTRLMEEVESLKAQRSASAAGATQYVEEIARLHALNTPLREALLRLFRLVEEGVLVRDVSRDGEPGWSMRALVVVTAVKQAEEALAPGKQSASAPGVDVTTSDNAPLWKPDPACTCGAYDAKSKHARSCPALRQP